MPEAAGGAQRVDKLVKAALKGSGDARLMHVEAQMRPEAAFAERMYKYSYRGRDRFGQPLISLAVLGDGDPKWRPKRYREGEHGSETTFRFRAVKLLRWARRLRWLEAHENLFALFVAAHLVALQTRGDEARRVAGKVRLLTNLVRRGLDELERGRWYRLIDWVLRLSPEADRKVWQELRPVLEGPKVAFITFAEKMAKEEGLRGALEALLKRRWGAEGAALMAGVAPDETADRLQALLLDVASAGSLDEARALFSASA